MFMPNISLVPTPIAGFIWPKIWQKRENGTSWRPVRIISRRNTGSACPSFRARTVNRTGKKAFTGSPKQQNRMTRMRSLNWENPCSTAMVSTKTKSRRARGSKKPPITNSTPASITQECALCGASMGRSIFRKECHSLKCLRIIRSQWPSSSLGNCMNMV